MNALLPFVSSGNSSTSGLSESAFCNCRVLESSWPPFALNSDFLLLACSNWRESHPSYTFGEPLFSVVVLYSMISSVISNNKNMPLTCKSFLRSHRACESDLPPLAFFAAACTQVSLSLLRISRSVNYGYTSPIDPQVGNNNRDI